MAPMRLLPSRNCLKTICGQAKKTGKTCMKCACCGQELDADDDLFPEDEIECIHRIIGDI